MTYVEKFSKILRNLEVLSKEQTQYKEEIMKVLIREDAATEAAKKEEI